MKVISALLLWLIGLSTAATAYTQASGQAIDIRAEDSLVISWNAPLQRENGELLSPSELVGYQIYYTVEETGESAMIDIDDSRVERYEFTNLTPGTYYFALAAVDDAGQVSELSELLEARVH